MLRLVITSKNQGIAVFPPLCCPNALIIFSRPLHGVCVAVDAMSCRSGLVYGNK